MSKMSWAHAELCEQAYELGFESLEDAINNGYETHIDGMTLKLVPNEKKQMELAHQAWLKERDGVLADLEELKNGLDDQDELDALDRAIDFIKKGEC